jgi:hypothetical protein
LSRKWAFFGYAKKRKRSNGLEKTAFVIGRENSGGGAPLRGQQPLFVNMCESSPARCEGASLTKAPLQGETSFFLAPLHQTHNTKMLRSTLKNITDIFNDLERDEGRLLLSIKPLIERFINYDENFHIQVGHLTIYTKYSKLFKLNMLHVDTESSLFKFSKVATLRILFYEPLFKNHVLMINNRQINGRL